MKQQRNSRQGRKNMSLLVEGAGLNAPWSSIRETRDGPNKKFLGVFEISKGSIRGKGQREELQLTMMETSFIVRTSPKSYRVQNKRRAQNWGKLFERRMN